MEEVSTSVVLILGFLDSRWSYLAKYNTNEKAQD